MKVAIITRFLPPRIGGVEDYTFRLAQSLANAGVRVTLISSIQTSAASPGHPLIRLQPAVERWDRKGIPRLIEMIRVSGADLVHLQFVPHLYGRYGVNWAMASLPAAIRRRTGKPVVTTCHELLSHRPAGLKEHLLQTLYRVQARLILRGSSQVVTPTEWQERQLHRLFPRLAGKIRRIPVGSPIPVAQTNSSETRRPDSGNRPFRLGTFGTGHPWWQYEMALRVLKGLQDRSIPSRLICIGDIASANPAYHRQLLSLETELGLTGSVEWTGSLPSEQVSRSLQSVDLFLALQRSGVTGRSTALAAALAHGLPILAAGGPDADRWLLDSGAMALVEPNDLPAAIRVTERLFSDPQSRKALGAKAQDLYQRHLSWERIGRRFLDLFQNLLADAGGKLGSDLSGETWRRCWKKWQDKGSYEADLLQHRQERGPLYRLLREGFRESGSPRPKVLEVGCGTAIDTLLLAEDPALRVVGLDQSFEALQVARSISENFARHPAFVLGEAGDLSFPDDTFDLVFSQGLLEHFRDPLPLLAEQARVLKPSGSLVVDVPQKFAGLGFYSLRKQWKIRRGTWEWGWETQYSYPELKRLGAAVGLIPAGVGGYGYDGVLNLFANPHLMIDKLPFLRRSRTAQVFKRFYLKRLKRSNDRLWEWLSRRFGHWLLICVAVRFQKRPLSCGS